MMGYTEQMNWLSDVISYWKDNPEGYWFKRKLYGWGWTPVTREGWFVTLLIIVAILGNAIRFEHGGYSAADVLPQVVIPTALLVVLLIVICYKTGEPPRWMWGPPKRDEDNVNKR